MIEILEVPAKPDPANAFQAHIITEPISWYSTDSQVNPPRVFLVEPNPMDDGSGDIEVRAAQIKLQADKEGIIRITEEQVLDLLSERALQRTLTPGQSYISNPYRDDQNVRKVLLVRNLGEAVINPSLN